jgi:hypothetical protein
MLPTQGNLAMKRILPVKSLPRISPLSLPLRAALSLCLIACCSPAGRAAAPEAKVTDREWEQAAQALAFRIDALMERHWQSIPVKPAAPVGDAAFLRRITLDLAGRIPTQREAVAFAEDTSPDKRTGAIRRLLSGPEYPLHMGRVLDEIIQGKNAGDGEFLEYLRTAVAARKSWDGVFRDILLGPWDADERKGARAFLARRLPSLDDLTHDTTVVFFGVNISCAKCHDHPLVEDWKQEHYFGMASFFNPTYEGGKKARGKPNDPVLTERETMPVTYVTTKGEKRSAKPMFLSGRVTEEPAPQVEAEQKAPPVSRREQLVQFALGEKTFFSKAIVNRLWAYLMGRGLVNPLDQMHAANLPVVPDVLDLLAEDLAANGYDLDRLVAALVSSRVYQLASARTPEKEEADATDFAVASLRPLTPAQYALSLVLATGDGAFDRAETPEERGKSYRDLEKQAAALTRAKLLDPRTERFQSSAAEALYMSNQPDVQKLTMPAGNNLTARLAALEDSRQLVETAVWTVLSRPPTEPERDHLVQWIEERKENRARACGQLVWALLTSAEFRFNH